MSNQQSYEMNDAEYSAEGFRTVERAKDSKRERPTMGRGRGKAPQSFNGMHRRRRRKMAW